MFSGGFSALSSNSALTAAAKRLSPKYFMLSKVRGLVVGTIGFKIDLEQTAFLWQILQILSIAVPALRVQHGATAGITTGT